MAHRDDFRRAARCPDCKLSPGLCVCGLLPRVELPVEFVFLRHRTEIRPQSSTGNLASRMLVHSRVVDHGVHGQPVDRARLVAGEGPHHVLYPLPGGTVLGRSHGRAAGAGRPVFILIDARWRSARRMLRRVTALAGLPILSLPDAPLRASTLRRRPAPQLSFTLEAVIRAVDALGHPAAARQLEEAWEWVHRRMLCARGKITIDRLHELERS